MYIPRHWHFVMPVGAVLTTFSINQWVLGGGFHWDYAVFVQVPVGAVAFYWGHFIDKAGIAYQNYATGASRPQAQETFDNTVLDWHTGKPVDEPAPGELRPIIRVDGKPRVAYSQVVRSVKEDKVRFVAFTLVRQHQNGFKADLTESRWVKNWKFSREEFLRDVIDPWKSRGIIGRAGERRNAPYDVLRWDAMQLIAQGEKLPVL